MVFNNGRLAAVLARSETQRARFATRPFQSEARLPRLHGAALLLLLLPGCSFKLPQPIPVATTETTARPSSAVTIKDEPDAAPESSTVAPLPTPSLSSLPIATASASESIVDAGPEDASLTDGYVNPCREGQAMCDGICLAEGACQCAQPCAPEHATADCYQGACRILQCDDGFIDCDGDASNGCEVSADLNSEPGGIQNVPRLVFSGEFSAIAQADWSQVRGYRIKETCAGCALNPAYDVVPMTPTENAGVAPSPSDLQASVKVAWNEQGFLLRMLISDDNWFLRNESVASPIANPDFVEDPRSFDNVELYWDSDGPNGFPEHIDHGLFFSADGARSQLLLRAQGTEFVNVTQTQLSATCRVVYAQLTPEFLLNAESQPLVLEAGQSYGFNIGVNDFDWGASDGGLVAQRQHQVFLIPMFVEGMADPYFVGATFESTRITLNN